MRCRNCGADLKPGIKYCLECGTFLDEDDDDSNIDTPGEIINNNAPIDFGPQRKVIKKKKRRHKMSTMDLLIYLGLGLVFVVSIIVIIVALVNGKEDEVYIPAEVDKPKETVKTVEVDDYKVKIDGNLSNEVKGSIIYVSDNNNYTFTYRNILDDYDKYSKDLSLLSEDLEENNYQLLDSEKMTISSREFLIYEIIADAKTKYLYLTRANKNYLSMGVIESIGNGDWKLALSTIAKMNDNIEFDTVYIEKETKTTEIQEVLEDE